ncbi:MAG TPA: imidazoleglycerol-phosphate dehydratase HisB [Ignavibacteriaceae bacterium]|nr:imidazoleglycerol-phosphate dehydratase HisB [Ignavibacteriaceae bacterium]
MKKIQIHDAFFDVDSSLSFGLISSLKKLYQKGFLIYAGGKNLTSNPSLRKIFENEDIIIEQNLNDPADAEFIITTENTGAANSIFVSEKSRFRNLEEAADEILKRTRSSSRVRKTKETDIKIKVSLDDPSNAEINTGIGFFDHMLEQISRHGNIGLSVKVKGDLHVDEHHTVEDVGIALGECLLEALGDKKGIKRYGYFVPMDESAAVCAIDLGGRTYLNFKCKFSREKVGDFPTELTEEFFRGLASGLKANIYIKSKGKNDHHKIEAIFKAFAKSLNEACRIDARSSGKLPSTKGVL